LVFAGLLKSRRNAGSPVRVATTESAGLYGKLPTSGSSESDGNPSVTDIRQRFVR